MLTQIQVIIEIVLSLFLLMGIIYSFYLSRVLSNLKNDRTSLIGLVDKLESSVKSAEEGVEKLRIAGEVSGRPLSRIIELAKITGTELDMAVDKADAMAHRLEALTMKALPHEKKLARLLEEADGVGIATSYAEEPRVQDTTRHMPPAEQHPDLNELPAEAQLQEEPTPAPATPPTDAESVAWISDRKEATEPSAPTPGTKRKPPAVKAPSTGQDQSKDSSNQILLSDGQQLRRLKRLEKTFLGR